MHGRLLVADVDEAHGFILLERVGEFLGRDQNLGVLFVAGLDVRYRWSSGIGPVMQIAAMLIVIAGYALVVWATGVNAFFSQVVRIQSERGHTVVSSGPYRNVRHPAYVGMLLVVLGAPIMLGSWWALIPGAISAVLMIVRTALEDRTLQAELPGYHDFAQHTRYRLLPGVW